MDCLSLEHNVTHVECVHATVTDTFHDAGHHSIVEEKCKACAVPLIQADSLPEGLHWGQLPNPAGCVHLV